MSKKRTRKKHASAQRPLNEERKPASGQAREENAAVSEPTENEAAELRAARQPEEAERVKEYRPSEKKPITDKREEADTFSESVAYALGGEYEDYTDYAAEESAEAEEAPAEKRPNKFYLVFAVFIIVMSIIGMYSSVRFIADGIGEIANQTSLKNEIALFIYPVVTVDPPAFAQVEELPSSVIVESALWRIILTGDTSNYEKLYNAYMYVPAVDVEFNIRALFGNAAEISHQTVGSASASFTYNEETNTYLVPISPRYTAYSPVITDISSVGELYTVSVRYMPPTALAIEGIKLQNEATKVMEYTLSKSKNSMTLHSIKNATNLGESYEY